MAAVWEQVTRNHGGPLRRGPAAVLHAILDRQVDSIEPVLEALEERIEAVEARVLERPHRADLVRLLTLKRTTLGLRRWLTKQREVLLRLARNEFSLVPAQEAVLFRDVYDHVFRFTDWLETHREMITSLQETYLSVTNLRLGEIMKFLTLFTAVLMPLTVITGIYGMNFEHMPELHRPWAYPAVLLLMAAVVVGGAAVFPPPGLAGHRRGAGSDPGPPPSQSRARGRRDGASLGRMSLPDESTLPPAGGRDLPDDRRSLRGRGSRRGGERYGQGTLTLQFADGKRCILSPQAPVRQIWVAFKDRAWHMNLDDASGRWVDDRGQRLELFRLVEDITKQAAGLEVPIGRIGRE